MSAVSPTTAESSSLRRLAEEVGAFVFGLRIADCGLSRRAAGVRPLRLTPDERCVTNDGGEQLFATACRRGGPGGGGAASGGRGEGDRAAARQGAADGSGAGGPAGGRSGAVPGAGAVGGLGDVRRVRRGAGGGSRHGDRAGGGAAVHGH